MVRSYGWADALPKLVESEPTSILSALREFVPDATLEQLDAWRESVRVLQQQGARVLQLRPNAVKDSTVLEYELPREGGRRPDVLVLQNGRVVVLEFKSTDRPRRADVDQVAAYARDLRSYHSACTDIDVVPALVIPTRRPTLSVDGVSVVGAAALADWLLSTATEFQSQGLELDLPIVCWGDDLRVEQGAWRLRPNMRPSKLVRDPHQLRTNAYRVLLTRGREGLVIFVPQDPVLAETHALLRACGAVAPAAEPQVAVA